MHDKIIKENYHTVEKLWHDFLINNPNNINMHIPESSCFCDNEKDANECAELVVQGIKQATATSLWWFERNDEPLPKVGDQFIVTDWNGEAKAIIETSKLEPTPFNKVKAKFAETEGEGDKSLSYWKRVHRAYYSREMKASGEKFDENMIILCEYFKTIWK